MFITKLKELALKKRKHGGHENMHMQTTLIAYFMRTKSLLKRAN
jgi:hypothetical protein